MNVTGLGLDLLEIARMEQMLEHDCFLQRAFHPIEREYILSRGTGAAQTAAGIFCAKEALVKATGWPLLAVLRRCPLHHQADGQPTFDIPGVWVTITHTDQTAAAAVLVTGHPRGPDEYKL